jgi:hypothetical protein
MEKNIFHFWTEKENHLILSKNTFFDFAINFSDEHVSNYIYEHDPILNEILELSAPYIHYGYRYNLHSLVTFRVENQYVLVREDCQFNVSLIGQYYTNKEAIDVIREDQKNLHGNSDDTYTYVIINLEHTKPFFLKSDDEQKKCDVSNSQVGKVKIISEINPGTFYKGSIYEPIFI